VNTKLDQFVRLLSNELGLLLSISFGVFLFILFFQPFPISRFDSNNSLLFVGGFSVIIFLFMVLVRIVFPWLFQNSQSNSYNYILPPYAGGFIVLMLNAVAFPFYLRYVGSVNISFYIMFKVVLICLAPPIALGLYDLIKKLKLQNESLILEKKIIQKQIEKYEDDTLHKTIEFYSENNTENLTLQLGEIALIRSADNYVEIVFLETNNFKKKLLRNTLKHIEQQLKPYSNFIRCHRICIVNTKYIERLTKNYNNHWIIIKGYEEQIPVSRQYLLKLKESQ
jgi:DNA-binding LytR/AlgR family response regulator